MTNYLEQAREQFALGYVAKAFDLFERAMETADDDLRRGEAMLETGKLRLLFKMEQAEEMCRRAAELLPEHAVAYYWLGMVYREQKQWQPALEAFETADQLHPDDPAVLANRGWALFQLGEREQGHKLLERALRLDLGRLDTLLDLAHIYIADDNFDGAYACALRAHELSYGGKRAQTVLDTVQRLRDQLQRMGNIPAKSAKIPRSRREWQQRISAASDPMALIQELLAGASFQSEKDLQRLAGRVMKEWNRSPRPELGGLAPNQIGGRQDRKLSVFDDAWRYPWLYLDQEQTEANTVRRDMVTFLTHIRDTRYTATAKLGNLPLKAVRAINELLIEPVELDPLIGDRVFKTRLVSEVWPIYFLQGLAITGRLVRFEPGRRIILTEEGQTFLKAASIRQLWTLFDAWWWHTDWFIAYQWQLLDEFTEARVPGLALRLLRSMPVGQTIRVSDFIDALVETGHLDKFTVTREDFLRTGLRRVTVDILDNFEVLSVKTREKDLGVYQVKEPVSFQVTPLGHNLLSAVGDWPSR